MKTIQKCDPWGERLVAYYSDGLQHVPHYCLVLNWNWKEGPPPYLYVWGHWGRASWLVVIFCVFCFFLELQKMMMNLLAYHNFLVFFPWIVEDDDELGGSLSSFGFFSWVAKDGMFVVLFWFLLVRYHFVLFFLGL